MANNWYAIGVFEVSVFVVVVVYFMGATYVVAADVQTNINKNNNRNNNSNDVRDGKGVMRPVPAQVNLLKASRRAYCPEWPSGVSEYQNRKYIMKTSQPTRD